MYNTSGLTEELMVPIEGKVLFLGPDLGALDSRIEALRVSVCAYNRSAMPKGPAAEVLMDEFQVVLDRLGYLVRLRRGVSVVACPYDADSVDVGVTVTYMSLNGGVTEPEQVSIGSAIVSNRLASRGFVSYLSDLALLLHGAVPGDVRHGVVANEESSFRVLAVDTAIPLLLRA